MVLIGRQSAVLYSVAEIPYHFVCVCETSAGVKMLRIHVSGMVKV